MFFFFDASKGLEWEGLFRISGNANLITELKNKFNRGEEVDLEGIDVHAVAGILKAFFRELPEPLLTYELYDLFMASIAINDSHTRLKQVKKVLEYLPRGNLLVLLFLISFLRRVADKSSKNMMNSNNLAIIFAPCILRNKSNDVNIQIEDTSYANDLVISFIDNFDKIFKDFNLAPSIKKEVKIQSAPSSPAEMRETSVSPPPNKPRLYVRNHSMIDIHPHIPAPPPPPPKISKPPPNVSSKSERSNLISNAPKAPPGKIDRVRLSQFEPAVPTLPSSNQSNINNFNRPRNNAVLSTNK